MTAIYIPRRLLHDERTISQADLFHLGKLVLVLAEPGAGKTELLADLGRTLDVVPRSASRFRHQTARQNDRSLLIDGLDEVARLDPSGLDSIIVKASETPSELVVLSSRSSEWAPSQTRMLRECFAVEPAIVRLLPFERNEQRAIFDALLPDESFETFVEEIDRLELQPLLGNPLFLELFANAYVQVGRRFESKRQIFVDAVTRLASERGDSPKQKSRAPTEAIIKAAEELFAKIL